MCDTNSIATGPQVTLQRESFLLEREQLFGVPKWLVTSLLKNFDDLTSSIVYAAFN